MIEEITLRVYTPERTVINRKVRGVVLPYGRVNLTIIADRAPTSLVLQPGKIDLLNADNQVETSYFIDSAVVDVANNVCEISTRHIMKTTALTIQEAEKLQQDEPQNADYYLMILEYLKRV